MLSKAAPWDLGPGHLNFANTAQLMLHFTATHAIIPQNLRVGSSKAQPVAKFHTHSWAKNEEFGSEFNFDLKGREHRNRECSIEKER